MVTIVFIVGLAFLLSGVLAHANISQVGMTYVSMLKIHTLPYINTVPTTWVYIGLGLILIIIAYGYSRK